MTPADEADWLARLRAECAKTSQHAAAIALGVSQAVVNQALRGTYKASTKNLEQRVRGVWMQERVTCPVLGEISSKKCQDEQRRPANPANPFRLRTYFACRRGCPNSSQPQLPPAPVVDWDAINKELEPK